MKKMDLLACRLFDLSQRPDEMNLSVVAQRVYEKVDDVDLIVDDRTHNGLPVFYVQQDGFCSVLLGGGGLVISADECK